MRLQWLWLIEGLFYLHQSIFPAICISAAFIHCAESLPHDVITPRTKNKSATLITSYRKFGLIYVHSWGENCKSFTMSPAEWSKQQGRCYFPTFPMQSTSQRTRWAALCCVNHDAPVIAFSQSKKEGGVNRSHGWKGWKRNSTNGFDTERWGESAGYSMCQEEWKLLG